MRAPALRICVSDSLFLYMCFRDGCDFCLDLSYLISCFVWVIHICGCICELTELFLCRVDVALDKVKEMCRKYSVNLYMKAVGFSTDTSLTA